MNKSAITFFVFGFFFQTPLYAASLSPEAMMKKNDEARRVNDFEAKAKITTGTEGEGREKIKEFTLSRKVQSDGVHNSTLTRFHSPAEVKNEGVLIIENASGRNDVLMYLPNFKKVRRVESQQQSGSFMGSVFSYSDIATPHVEDFKYKVLKEEKCTGSEASGVTCSVIECVPVNDDVKERTGYSKSLLWIRHDNFMSTHAEYYNLDGEHFKDLEMSEVKIIDEKNKKWLAHQVYIKNLKTKEYTRLQFSNVKANKGLTDSIFTQQYLQKVN